MEKTFKDAITSLMEEQSWWVLSTHEPLRQGVPDLSAVCQGRAVWLELKKVKDVVEVGDSVTLTHELTAPQSKMLRDLGNAGAISGVLIGYNDRTCTFIPADDLRPGPMKKFTVRQTQTLDGFISWLGMSAMAGSF